MDSVANNVYGWYPPRKHHNCEWDNKLIFEFFNREFEIEHEDLDNTDIVSDAREIQDLIFAFEQKYIDKK